MAEIENEQYKVVDWTCPNCGTFYPMKYIGLTFHSFYRCYFFCEKDCARYFTINNKDITSYIENPIKEAIISRMDFYKKEEPKDN